ncbi:hypothetical protein A5868_001410, partial [Enterococcus sp. 12F9_DIV0723]
EITLLYFFSFQNNQAIPNRESKIPNTTTKVISNAKFIFFFDSNQKHSKVNARGIIPIKI